MPSCWRASRPPSRGRSLDDEAALRPDRHDQRVLDHLGLHQPEHLGPEVLGPVRPAQAAARHAAAAQMHPLDARRVDEDLELRLWQRQHRDLGGVELERQVRVRLAVAVGLEGVGADDRADDADRKLRRIRSSSRLGTASSASSISLPSRSAASSSWPSGSSRASNSLTISRTMSGMAEQRAPDVGVREADATLAQVLGDGADDRHLPSGQGGAEHESVQGVVLELAPPHAHERVVEQIADPLGVLSVGLQAEVVDPRRAAIGGRDLVRALVGDLRAEVLERGQDLGQQHAAGAEQLAGARSPRATRAGGRGS